MTGAELKRYREAMDPEPLPPDELEALACDLEERGMPPKGGGFVCYAEATDTGLTTEVRPMKDETILMSMRPPTRWRLSMEGQEILDHRDHEGFSHYHCDKGQAYIISCPACDNVWDVDSRSLLEALPEARDAINRLQRHYLTLEHESIEPMYGPAPPPINFGTTFEGIFTPIKPTKQSRQEKARAEKTARQLLFRTLRRKHIRIYKKLGYVEAVGKNGRVYKIESSGFHNVTTVIDGVEHRYCLMSTVKVPPSDSVLAQKLWIENDTEEFLRVANLISPRPMGEISYTTGGGTNTVTVGAGQGYVTTNTTNTVTNLDHFTTADTSTITLGGGMDNYTVAARVGVELPLGVEDNPRPWLDELLQ